MKVRRPPPKIWKPLKWGRKNMTNDMKTQLDGLIDAIKDVVETIPTKTSEITNDSGYLTEH